MSPGQTRPMERIELLMLAGAVVAPFNFFLGVPIAGLYLRPLHIWGFIVSLAVVALYREELVERISGALLAFWGMFAFILLATLLATPAEYKFRGVADAGLLFLNVLALSAVFLYYSTRSEGWFRFFFVLGISSVCMSLLLIARAVGIAKTEVVTGVDSYALGLGTVAGTYTATFAAAATAAMVFATSRRGFLLALGALLVHGIAALLSLARGPWLAFAVSVVVIVPLAAWRFRGRFSALGTLMRGGAILVALPTLAGIALIFSPFVRGLVMQRFFELVNLEAGTGSARLIMWRAFLHDAFRSPVFGHGAAAYRDISEALGVQGTVSENFVVEVFHAGGAVAVVLLIVALVSVMMSCLLRPGARRHPAHVAACLTGAATLAIASMTNPAAWNGLFWVLLGLVASRPVEGEELDAREPVTLRATPDPSTRGAVVPSSGSVST